MSARDFICLTSFMEDGCLAPNWKAHVSSVPMTLSDRAQQAVWHISHIRWIIVCPIHYPPWNEPGGTKGVLSPARDVWRDCPAAALRIPGFWPPRAWLPGAKPSVRESGNLEGSGTPTAIFPLWHFEHLPFLQHGTLSKSIAHFIFTTQDSGLLISCDVPIMSGKLKEGMQTAGFLLVVMTFLGLTNFEWLVMLFLGHVISNCLHITCLNVENSSLEILQFPRTGAKSFWFKNR